MLHCTWTHQRSASRWPLASWPYFFPSVGCLTVSPLLSLVPMIVQQLRACSGLCLRKGPVQGWGRLLLLLLLLRSLVGRDDRQRRYEMQQSCPACSSSASAGPWPAESSTANGANAAVRRQKKAAAVVPHLLARACVRATDGTASTGCVGEWITSASRPGPPARLVRVVRRPLRWACTITPYTYRVTLRTTPYTSGTWGMSPDRRTAAKAFLSFSALCFFALFLFPSRPGTSRGRRPWPWRRRCSRDAAGVTL